MKTLNTSLSVVGAAAFAIAVSTAGLLRAADHADGPTVAGDQGADIADTYAFLDPNDNDQIVLLGTLRGFIVPGESNNFGIFDSGVRYSFAIENTGDAKPDLFIDVTFTPRAVPVGGTKPDQQANISFRGAVPAEFKGNKGRFTAEVTQPSLNATAPQQVVVALANPANPTPGIEFFAGEVDDPFFFDIPAFSRFVTAVRANDPTAADNLNRGRDTFAGYNIMAICLRMPAAMLRSTKSGAPSVIGVSSITARKDERPVHGVKAGNGPYLQVDRIGIPGINAVIIPYNHKDLFNGSTPIDDAKGKFFDDIAGTFIALGTDAAHLAILAQVAGLPPAKPVKKSDPLGTGDYLRLETDKSLKPNDGVGGLGSNANGFPNGRRPGDDVIDTIIFLATNGGITTGDHVNANDRPFQAVFPFLATPNQPRDPNVDPLTNADDGTRN